MAGKPIHLSHAELKDRLTYKPCVGSFYWNQDIGGRRIKAGSEAGGFNKDGYVLIGVDGSRFFRSELAYFWMEAQWPDGVVDHCNGVRADDRWENLRLCSKIENNRNKRLRADNISGVTGVSWNSRSGVWVARIKVGKKYLWLGSFSSLDDAVAARHAAELEHFGAFSPLVCRSE